MVGQPAPAGKPRRSMASYSATPSQAMQRLGDLGQVGEAVDHGLGAGLGEEVGVAGPGVARRR